MIYEFTATQDLHGYDEPWAPGSKSNKWNEEWEVGLLGNATGLPTPATDHIRSSSFSACEAETTYYINSPAGKGGIKIFWYAADETFISTPSAVATGTVISPENAAYFKIETWSVNYGVVYNHDIAVNYPDSDHDYLPYANVCMPEGFNLWDPTNQEYIQVYAGYVNANTRELYLRPVYEEYAGEELVGPWMSSWDPYEEDTTPTEGAFVIDFGGELTSFEITPFMLQTLLDSLGIRQHFTDGAGLLNSLMDQAQGRVRSEEELLNRSRPLKVIAIGDQLPAGLKIRPISKDVLPGLPGKFIR